jgi:hypothetical protein
LSANLKVEANIVWRRAEGNAMMAPKADAARRSGGAP